MRPIKQPWNNIAAKTSHKCIGTILATLKITSKGLKTCPESIYRISNYKIFICLPAVRPSSTSARAPDLSEDHCRIVRFMNLLFRRRFVHCALILPFILQSFPFFLYIAYRRREIWLSGFKQRVDKLLHNVLIMSWDKPLIHWFTCL